MPYLTQARIHCRTIDNNSQVDDKSEELKLIVGFTNMKI